MPDPGLPAALRGLGDTAPWPRDLLGLPRRLRDRLARGRDRRRLQGDLAALLRTATGTVGGGGPRVGIATFGSGEWHLVLEILLAHALALRGAAPSLLVCDLPSLPACDERTACLRDPSRCPGCVEAKRPLLETGRIPWRGLREFVAPAALDRARALVAALPDADIADYRHPRSGAPGGLLPLGRWTYVSACHFLRDDARGADARAIAARRAFLTSAIVVVDAVDRWLDALQPDVVIAESGAHVMWRIACELARHRGIRTVCRELGKGGWDHHLYAVDAECMAPDLTRSWAEARDRPLSAAEEARVDAYLRDLPARTYPDARRPARADPAGLRRRLGLLPDRRVAVAFTNVTWDLATAGRDVAFDGLLDWLLETCDLAAASPEVEVVIRVHPAERGTPAHARLLDRLGRARPTLPANVRTIAPEEPVDARDLCALADVVLAYCTTAGLEAAAAGRPVLLCGAPHYRGRGFTIDVASRQDYRSAITGWAARGLSAPPDAAVLARRYAHLFFLRYHLPMGWTTSPLEPPFRLRIADLAELAAGRNPSVDAVCSGVLEGREILLPRSP